MNSTPVLAVTLAVLSGCGHEQIVTVCRGAGLRVTVAYETDCQAVTHNMVAARRELAAGGVLPEERFAEEFSELAIHVRADRQWVNYSGNTVDGAFDAFAGVEVDWSMDGLAHELLHAVDWHRFNVSTGTHAGWDTNGYNEISKKYRRAWQPPQLTPPSEYNDGN